MRAYRGYTGVFSLDEDTNWLFGEVIGTSDVITFRSQTAAGIVREFRKSVDVYLDHCAKIGKEPDKPFSGNLSLRTDPEQHRRMVEAAATSGKSLNQWMVDALQAYLEVSGG